MKKQLVTLLAGGDGIGKEIMPQLKLFLTRTINKFDPELSLVGTDILVGGDSIKEHTVPLTEEVKGMVAEADLTIKGPTDTESGKGAPSANVGLRRAGNFYACVRPIKHFDNVPTPYTKPQDINWVIFRENTEGLYGMPNLDVKRTAEFIAFLQTSQFKDIAAQLYREGDMVMGFGITSELATKRLMRAAINWAKEHGETIITVTNKSNIFKQLDGRFVDWALECAQEEFGDLVKIMPPNTKVSRKDAEEEFQNTGLITIDTCIADAFLAKSFQNPENFGIIVANNYNGDLFSDYAAALIGGLGIAPGINVNFETGRIIAEATHGSAPDIVNQNKANPCSMLLSVLWALRLQGGEWESYSLLVINALQSVLDAGYMTGDFARFHEDQSSVTKLGTQEFLEKLEQEFYELLPQ